MGHQQPATSDSDSKKQLTISNINFLWEPPNFETFIYGFQQNVAIV